MWYKRFLWLPLLIIVVFGAIVFGDGVYFNFARQQSSLQTASHDLSTSQTKTAHAPTTPPPAATTQAASTTHAAVVPPAPTHRDYTSATTSMSQYTDSDFGFSFWYPSSWTREAATGRDIKDCTARKAMSVHGTGYATGVTVGEYVCPNLSMTLLGVDDTNPVGMDFTYYFDTNTHTWMTRELSGPPDDSPVRTYPTDIRNNTMGGLHIFFGEVRHGLDVVVPLSATHFLVIDANGDFDERSLANTVMATDPSVATPTSTEVQLQTIQAEKDAYNNLDNTPLR